MKQQTTVGGRECLLYTDGRAGGQQCPCGICASDGATRYRQMHARMEPRQSFRRWSHPHSQRLCVVPFKTEKQSCQQRNIKEYIDRFMIKIQEITTKDILSKTNLPIGDFSPRQAWRTAGGGQLFLPRDHHQIRTKAANRLNRLNRPAGKNKMTKNLHNSKKCSNFVQFFGKK